MAAAQLSSGEMPTRVALSVVSRLVLYVSLAGKMRAAGQVRHRSATAVAAAAARCAAVGLRAARACAAVPAATAATRHVIAASVGAVAPLDPARRVPLELARRAPFEPDRCVFPVPVRRVP